MTKLNLHQLNKLNRYLYILLYFCIGAYEVSALFMLLGKDLALENFMIFNAFNVFSSFLCLIIVGVCLIVNEVNIKRRRKEIFNEDK